MSKRKIEHVLARYAKDADNFIGENALKKFDLKTIQKVFNLPDDDPAYDGYPVTPSNVGHFAEWFDEELDFDRFEYFIETHELPDRT